MCRRRLEFSWGSVLPTWANDATRNPANTWMRSETFNRQKLYPNIYSINNNNMQLYFI